MRMFSMKGASADAGRFTAAQTMAWSGSAAALVRIRAVCIIRANSRLARPRPRFSRITPRPWRNLRCADYGYALSPEDQRRRYLTQSLCSPTACRYHNIDNGFGGDVITDFVELDELESRPCARTPDRFQLHRQEWNFPTYWSMALFVKGCGIDDELRNQVSTGVISFTTIDNRSKAAIQAATESRFQRCPGRFHPVSPATSSFR